MQSAEGTRQALAEPYLIEAMQRVSSSAITITERFNDVFIFDHIVKYWYSTLHRGRTVAVVGDASDSYFAVYIRNILREECALKSPLIGLDALNGATLEHFQLILVCYPAYIVKPALTTFAEKHQIELDRIVYLDEVIIENHGLSYAVAKLGSSFGPRDIIRGLLGQNVEESRALQLDAWNALKEDIARSGRANLVHCYGSGCGLLPLMLSSVCTLGTVYEPDPGYLSIIKFLSAPMGEVHTKPMAGVPVGIDYSGDDLVLSDALNRFTMESFDFDILNAFRNVYVTVFVSASTKPLGAASFRVLGRDNYTYSKAWTRDGRVVTEENFIWLPRRDDFDRRYLGRSWTCVYDSREHYTRDGEFSAGYCVFKSDNSQ